MDFCHVARAWALGKGRGAIECWVLIIKEKLPDKVIEVDLANVLPKCLERSGGVPWSWAGVSKHP